MNSNKGCLRVGLTMGLVLLVGSVAWKWIFPGSDETGRGGRGGAERPVPVQVADIRVGVIDETREFSGSLEPSADIRVAPRVSGRVVSVLADLSDPVSRGQILAELDDAEFHQQLTRAEADLAVARARQTEARNRLEIARREKERIEKLSERGVSSAASLDESRAQLLVREAAVDVAVSEVKASEAAVETAKLRLADTRVKATWSEGDEGRVVASRMVEEGDMVQANDPLFRVVEMDPVQAVVFVPERDYARMRQGQPVMLRTDAWPGEEFEAEIARISPLFEEESRQARVEITAVNPKGDNGYRLKPGMFVRASVVLDHVEGAVLVPEDALTRRDNVTGVFQVKEEGKTAVWVEVTPGIRHGGWVQLLEPELSGRVVTLGQQLLDTGSVLLIEGDESRP